jgi:hypothetical protein
LSIISDALAQASTSHNEQKTKAAPSVKKPKIVVLVSVSLIAICLIGGLMSFKTMSKEQLQIHVQNKLMSESSRPVTKTAQMNLNSGNPQISLESTIVQSHAAAINKSSLNNSLQGIIQSADGYHAILNNKIVSVNSVLSAGTVTNITNSSLTLKNADGEMVHILLESE